jgi:hypothetical protein
MARDSRAAPRSRFIRRARSARRTPARRFYRAAPAPRRRAPPGRPRAASRRGAAAIISGLSALRGAPTE